MRILKIELQNINSLRCETPIVIDFESDRFRDVGLYAITGSTGAGKTTLLDAITIALYHRVPRFNPSHVKAGLEDVVSHGAYEAMSRITFASSGLRYEAQWNLRLASKTGKLLGKPKEEVRLKNLSDEQIVSEKKSQVQQSIEEITQLNYHQFLRSVMLAQGEFAAFLSAKAQDKAELLEQITGEEIYKKIGEAINAKRYEEKKKLDALNQDVNAVDVLSIEQREVLQVEEKQLADGLKAVDADSKTLSVKNDWFVTERKHKNELLKLAEEREQLKLELEKNQVVFKAIEKHELAEPFKALNETILRLEKEQFNNQKEKDKLHQQLNGVAIEVKEIKQLAEGLKEEKDKAEQHNQTWQPKLEKVSKLDADLENINSNIKSKQQDVVLLNQSIEAINESIEKGLADKQEKQRLYDGLIEFLKNNKKLTDIEKVFSRWNTQLTSRMAQFSRQKELSQQITQDANNLKEIKVNISALNQQIASAKKRQEPLERSLAEKVDKLAKQPVDALLRKQQELSNKREKLLVLYQLAEDYKQQRLNLNDLKQSKRNTANLITQSIKELQGTKQERKLAEKSLADAEKILKLEQTIKNYEADRKQLKAGEPCFLCGSTDHPFVEKYEVAALDKSALEVEKRKKILDDILAQGNKQERHLAKLQAQSEEQDKNQQSIQKTSDALKIKIEAEGYSVDVLNIISEEGNRIRMQLDELKNQLEAIQTLQKEKEANDKLLQKEKDQLNTHYNELAKLLEQEKLVVNKLSNANKDLKEISEALQALEQALESNLNLFELELPKVGDSDVFLLSMEKQIMEFNAKEKQKNEISSALEQLKVHFENRTKQYQEKADEKAKLEKEILTLQSKQQYFFEERSKILVLDVSIEQKRTALQLEQKVCAENFENANKKHQEKETLLAMLQKEQEHVVKKKQALLDELNQAELEFNDKLKNSVFSKREEVEHALLDDDTKEKYRKVKKQLENAHLQLETLWNKLQKDVEAHLKDKNFEASELEVQSQLKILEKKREEALKRVGEIKQKLSFDDDLKKRNEGFYKAIEKQEKEWRKWVDLMELLGGSKHAFNTYVQRLTLAQLIDLANIHLIKLNKRYSLKLDKEYKEGEELNFKLIDHFQTNEARLVDTSSGGEKFLISLALALGLSDLSSHNVSIGSLFIDEGFGTLDNNTLETVISTLETLQSQGKMIGIISHVENLKERIPTQIQVIKKCNGVSRVEII